MTELATVTSLGFSIFSTYNGRGVTSARRDVNDLTTTLERNRASLASSASSFFSLSTAAAALGPAIVPIGAAVLGVGAATATMGVAAGAALGAYGLAMRGAIANTEKMAKAHKALTPIQATFISSLHQMKAAMDGMSTGTMNLTLHTATLVVQGLTSVIRGMTPVIRAVAPVVDEVANAFKKWAAGDGLKRFVDIVIKDGVPALHNLLNAGRSVLGFLGDGFRALAPTIVPMSKAIADGAANLKKWADNGGFANFLTMVHNNAPSVKAFFEALGAALKNVGVAMAGLGPLSLSLATVLLRIVAALPPSVLQAIIVGVLGIRSAMLLWAIATTAVTVAQIALDVAASPFFLLIAGAALTVVAVTAAVVALGVGLYFLVTRWSAVQAGLVVAWNATWNAMKVSGIAVWDAMKVAWSATVAAFGTAWAAFSAAMKTAWNGLWSALSTAFGAFSAAMKVAWSAMWSALSTAYGAFSAAMKVAWNGLWSALSTAYGAFSAAMKTAWNFLWSALSTAYGAFSAAMKKAWDLLWSALSTAYGAFSAAMKKAWDFLWSAMSTLYGTFSAAMKKAWSLLWSALSSAFGTFSAALKKATSLLMSAMTAAWDAGAKAIGKAWENIKKLVRDPIQAVVSVVYNNGIVKLWNTVAGVFGAPKLSGFTLPAFASGGAVRGPGTGTSDSITARLSNNEHVITAQEVAGAGGHQAVARQRQQWLNGGGSHPVRTMGSARNPNFALGGGIHIPGTNINIDPGGLVKSAFDVVTGFGGDVLGQLAKLAMGEVAGIVNPLIQKAADAGKTVVKGIIPGSPWIEDLIAGGKAGVVSTGGSNPQDTSGGTQGALKVGNGLIQQMADYIKNWITAHDVVQGGANVADAQKWADAQVGKPYQLGGFGSTLDCSSFMSGIAQIILGHAASPLFTTFAFTGAKQGPATFEKDLKSPFMVGVENRGVGHMAGTLNGKNYEATPPAVRSGPSARGATDPLFDMIYGMKAAIGGGQGVIPAGEHLAIIDAALAAAGVPPPGTKAQWEAGLNTLITRESNWNSSAVNNTDSNAAAGHPSKGLAQVIQPTFDAFHVAGTSSNLLDPIANVAAAINYIVHTYGNISNVQQANASLPPKGYRKGTDRARKGWHMIDEDGGEWINFRGGEKVMPHGKSPAAAGGSAPVVVNVENHWHGNPTKEAVQHAEGGMAEKLRQACVAGVGGRNH